PAHLSTRRAGTIPGHADPAFLCKCVGLLCCWSLSRFLKVSQVSIQGLADDLGMSVHGSRRKINPNHKKWLGSFTCSVLGDGVPATTTTKNKATTPKSGGSVSHFRKLLFFRRWLLFRWCQIGNGHPLHVVLTHLVEGILNVVVQDMIACPTTRITLAIMGVPIQLLELLIELGIFRVGIEDFTGSRIPRETQINFSHGSSLKNKRSEERRVGK